VALLWDCYGTTPIHGGFGMVKVLIAEGKMITTISRRAAIATQFRTL
jgi:hypothetical protein